MVRIAIDAMGGDHAPLAIVRGAEAAAAVGAGDLVLVGDENVIGPLLQSRSGIDIVHAPTSVEMKESPSTALRKKKDSSINVAFSLLKAGDVQAVVSAGNSGAVLAFAIFTLGRLPGVERPAILTIHPNVRGTKSILLDSGGTVDCRPSHLVQFAIMGDVFAKYALGVQSPRVGVLSNGEEATKGNELTRETHALLSGADLNYMGYLEGMDLYNGMADVVVTDGFVGNVALKVSEGVAEAIHRHPEGKDKGEQEGKDRLSFTFPCFQSPFPDGRLLRIRRRPPCRGGWGLYNLPRQVEREGDQERHLTSKGICWNERQRTYKRRDAGVRVTHEE